MVRYGAARRTRAPYDDIDRAGHYIRYIVCCVHHDRHLFYSFFCFFPFVIIILTKKNKKTRTLERKKEKKNIKNFLLLLWLVVAVCVYDILIHEIIGWQPSSRRHWTRKSFPLFIGSALCESLRPAERRAPATSPSAYSFIFLIFSSFPRIVRPLSGITAAAN